MLSYAEKCQYMLAYAGIFSTGSHTPTEWISMSVFDLVQSIHKLPVPSQIPPYLPTRYFSRYVLDAFSDAKPFSSTSVAINLFFVRILKGPD